ncbi:hypothetical protein [Bradyrhizobium sp. WSM1417]|uniref:hypothetical protein n=1 Tax=Bradyrhizobium sp. WSM1417 TaxID=754500 RepID=UPI0012EB2200|nr:hypothetical protein [Bradyrhizobium sp. WSM1417]
MNSGHPSYANEIQELLKERDEKIRDGTDYIIEQIKRTPQRSRLDIAGAPIETSDQIIRTSLLNIFDEGVLVLNFGPQDGDMKVIAAEQVLIDTAITRATITRPFGSAFDQVCARALRGMNGGQGKNGGNGSGTDPHGNGNNGENGGEGQRGNRGEAPINPTILIFAQSIRLANGGSPTQENIRLMFDGIRGGDGGTGGKGGTAGGGAQGSRASDGVLSCNRSGGRGGDGGYGGMPGRGGDAGRGGDGSWVYFFTPMSQQDALKFFSVRQEGGQAGTPGGPGPGGVGGPGGAGGEGSVFCDGGSAGTDRRRMPALPRPDNGVGRQGSVGKRGTITYIARDNSDLFSREGNKSPDPPA